MVAKAVSQDRLVSHNKNMKTGGIIFLAVIWKNKTKLQMIIKIFYPQKIVFWMLLIKSNWGISLIGKTLALHAWVSGSIPLSSTNF